MQKEQKQFSRREDIDLRNPREENQEKYWHWLHNVPKIYRKKIHLLITYFQKPKAIYETTKRELEKLEFLKKEELESILKSRVIWDFQAEGRRLKEKGIRFLSIDHPEYPRSLLNISDYPYGIYVRGATPLPDKKTISIVGARICSTYGKQMARKIATALAEHQVQIISGLAYGIDEIAQRSAIDAGTMTFGVLGCGVDICYPKENFLTYRRILEQGGVLSEFPPGTQPLPHHFPMRNRLISGLSDVLIIIEAKRKSGTLITADFALEQGKDVYAVPGRMEDEMSSGCNYLISQGAGIILSIEQLLEELNLSYEENKKKSSIKKVSLEKTEKIVYSCLEHFKPKNIQILLEESLLNFHEITQALLTLELKEYIVEVGKNYYVKKV